MESNENMVKMVMADVPNMTEAAAKEMASYHALREKNLNYKGRPQHKKVVENPFSLKLAKIGMM